MTEIDRIRDQIERALDGDPWCGPSLMSVLEGVTTDQAARRLPGLSHSIWQVVLHVSAWQEAVARRVAGEPVSMPEEGEWPAVDDSGDPAWQGALQRLGDSRDPAMGSGMTAYANLHGIAQHAMYHAGQIAILKKLLGI
jgi:DinB superfamily